MKNLPHILAKVYREPWLITPTKHRAIQALLEAHVAGTDITVETEEDDEDNAMAHEDGAAIIPVHGIIGKHLSQMEMVCGGCDLASVGNMIDAAEADTAVDRVVFDFRTPGGTVTGVPEMGRKIASMSKPTTAFTDTECCSAGYWLASQCNRFLLTESATTGSVGVYSVFMDYTRALANEGVEVNAISAGKYKLAGAPFREMSDDERAMFQAGVDKLHEQFKEAVRRHREIPDAALEGQCYDGMEACDLGLADGLVEEFSEALS